MAEYIYTREIVNNSYNINNPLRVDGEGHQIFLAKEVEAAIPGKIFTLICSGSDAKFIFSLALTSGEMTILDNTVTAHKNNT